MFKTEAIANQIELLEQLPKQAVVAEIGVDSGLLHLIDIWDTSGNTLNALWVLYWINLKRKLKKAVLKLIAAGLQKLQVDLRTDISIGFILIPIIP